MHHIHIHISSYRSLYIYIYIYIRIIILIHSNEDMGFQYKVSVNYLRGFTGWSLNRRRRLMTLGDEQSIYEMK